MPATQHFALIRWGTWAAGTLPGAILLWYWHSGRLGVVPGEVLLHQSGRIALVYLVA